MKSGCHLRPFGRRTDRPVALCARGRTWCARSSSATPRTRSAPPRVERAHRSRREAMASSSIADGVMERWFTPAFHRPSAAPNSPAIATCLIRQSVEGYAATCAAIRDADFTSRRQAHRPSRPFASSATRTARRRRTWCYHFAELIPGARFEVIPTAAHIPCVEQPEALIAVIRAFSIRARRAVHD